jgi:DNA-directed RNA polymerase subunit M/transcription elongation factor TFIIS
VNLAQQKVEYKDIRDESTERKGEVYRLIDDLINLFGFKVGIKEHKSGFPAVTVDCGGVHILTDIITLEQWQANQKKEKYLKEGGTHCPYCGSENISAGYSPHDHFDEEGMWQFVTCQDCGKEWKDIYQLVDIEEVKWQEVKIEPEPKI